MRIVLDDNPVDHSTTTVEQAMEWAAAAAARQGRMIVEVIVDGRTWSAAEIGAMDRGARATLADDAARLAAAWAGGCLAEEVHFFTAVPAELVAQTFSDAVEVIEQIDMLQRDAADLIQADQLPKAMGVLEEAVSLWMQVQEAVTMGAAVSGPGVQDTVRRELHATTGEEGASGAAMSPLDELHHRLKAMREALASKDSVALADTLLYDFPPVMARWRALLAAWSRTSSAAPPSALGSARA